MRRKILRYYQTSSGLSPCLVWLSSIKDKLMRARIKKRLDRVETGHYGDYKSLGDGVYELRLHFGPGYRIYFAEKDQVVVILLCAGDKAKQDDDIKIAKRYWHELRERSYD